MPAFRFRLSLALLAALASCAPVPSAEPPAVRAGPTLADAVAARPELSVFAEALRRAGLTGTLAGSGPYTVLAPSDAAFGRLDRAAYAALFANDNRAALTTVLRHHIVSGAFTAADLQQRVAAGGGTATVPTLSGQALRLSLENGNLVLTDANGTKVYVDTADLRQGNGVLHVVNGVLAPELP